MVSISKIGQRLTFNAQPNQAAKNISMDKPADKAKLQAFVNNQKNNGYAFMTIGLLSAATSIITKNKPARILSTLPAAFICVAMGSNMLAGGKAVEKALAIGEPEKPVMDKQG